MYVIIEYDKYWKYAPLSRVKVHGIIMGVYREHEQPNFIFESKNVLAATRKWETPEKATAFLHDLQSMNGAEF